MSDESKAIDISSGSRERVAYDLARHIQYCSDAEYSTEEEILTLYRKCYKAASGRKLEQILQAE